MSTRYFGELVDEGIEVLMAMPVSLPKNMSGTFASIVG